MDRLALCCFFLLASATSCKDQKAAVPGAPEVVPPGPAPAPEKVNERPASESANAPAPEPTTPDMLLSTLADRALASEAPPLLIARFAKLGVTLKETSKDQSYWEFEGAGSSPPLNAGQASFGFQPETSFTLQSASVTASGEGAARFAESVKKAAQKKLGKPRWSKLDKSGHGSIGWPIKGADLEFQLDLPEGKDPKFTVYIPTED